MVPPTPPQRPRHYIVLAVLNFVVVLPTAVWSAVLGYALYLDNAKSSDPTGRFTVWLMLLMNLANVILLTVGGIGLLRVARWGLRASFGYAGFGLAAAVILYLTGANPLFAFALMVYPVALLGVLTARPAAPTPGS